MKLSISEVLEIISKLSTPEERINALRNNSHPALFTVLKGAFDKNIKWLLPEGAPPYKPNDLVDQQHAFYTECRKMYLFIEGGNSNLSQTRREHLFIQLLETIDPKDAQLLLNIKDRIFPYNITQQEVQLAFPGLIDEQ